ncbi:hypothetical protein ACXX7C_003015 [Clostridium botulinum]
MEKSFVFNSVNGDRRYKAEDFREYFASFIGNGVFPNPSTNLQVIANSNMTITIKQGKAWLNGAIYINTDDYILNIDVADGVLNRIDRVVLRMDTAERKIYSYVKKGQFASSPVAPTLQRDADAYELALADVAVNKGAISITQANITDLRLDKNLCGIVHGTVDQIDVTTLFNQYSTRFKIKSEEFEKEFEDWLKTLKDVLGEDTAGNLLNLITKNTESINNIKSDLADITTDEDRLTENKTITGAINELFTFASNGKIKIATAITGKGVQASGSDSFDTLSNKITSIKVGDCNFGDVFPVSKIELVNKQPQIWNFIGHSSKVNAIAVDKSGYIYSGSDDNTFKEINSNGQQVLSFNPDNTPVKKIAVDKNGYIYIATNKSVIKMDKQGNIFWSYNFPYINSLTVDSAGYVYAASTSAICINPNGEKEWITSSGDTINAIAVTGNGNVYTGKQNQSSSLKKIVGEPKWYNTYYNADYIATDAMEGDYSSIYVASCLNVKEIRDHGDHADTGWTTKISNYPDYAMYFVSTLKLYNNRIYIGTKESVVKLDKQGNILWRFNTDNVRVNAIAVDGNENMYIGSDDNTVKKLIDGVAIISRS